VGLGPEETAFDGADENLAGVGGPEEVFSKVSSFLHHFGGTRIPASRNHHKYNSITSKGYYNYNGD